MKKGFEFARTHLLICIKVVNNILVNALASKTQQLNHAAEIVRVAQPMAYLLERPSNMVSIHMITNWLTNKGPLCITRY